MTDKRKSVAALNKKELILADLLYFPRSFNGQLLHGANMVLISWIFFSFFSSFLLFVSLPSLSAIRMFFVLNVTLTIDLIFFVKTSQVFIWQYAQLRTVLVEINSIFFIVIFQCQQIHITLNPFSLSWSSRSILMLFLFDTNCSRFFDGLNRMNPNPNWRSMRNVSKHENKWWFYN